MKMKKLLFIMLMSILPLITQAWDYTHTISGGEATITGYTGSGGDIVIPDFVYQDQYPVVAIAESAFEDCTNLTHVTIGQNVISIGPKAFHGCFAMTEIIIPENVTSIEWRALEECTSLTSCTIPNSISNIHMVFMGCTNLTSVTLPDSLVSLGSSAFSECTSLMSITLPESITAIGSGTFSGCTSLVNITIPDGVSSLGQHAFQGCTSLLGVNIPDGVTEVAYCAFEGCSGLISIIIPDGVTLIAQWAFENCTSLTTITIPASVTKIEQNAFEGCSDLSKFYCEGDAPAIADWENPIFENAPHVTVYYLLGTTGWESTFSSRSTELWMWKDFTFSTADNKVTITGYTGLETEIIIPETIEGLPVATIGGYAFDGCTNLTRITIGENISAIKYNAFKDCSGLTQITIPADVNEIGFNVFLNCSNLTAFNVDPLNATYSTEDGILFNKDKTRILAYPPVRTGSYTLLNSVTYIGNAAFRSCNLTSITMGEQVTDIGNEVFYTCSLLKSLYCEGNVPSHYQTDVFVNSPHVTVYYLLGTTGWGTTFGGQPTAPWVWADYTFTISGNSASITGYTGTGGDITIPASIEGKPVLGIGNGAFQSCTSLTGVVLPDSVTSIGLLAFADCSYLQNVNFGNNLAGIGNGAFRNCIYLTNITLPESVTYVGRDTFSGCSNLTGITIPAGVTSVGINAFKDCIYLKRFWCEGNAPSPEWDVFDGSPFVTVYYLPETTGWGDTFGGCPTAPWMWKGYTFVIVDNEATITGYTGSGGDITIPSVIEGSPVVRIGFDAFRSCNSLVSVLVPDSVAEIQGSAFRNCTNLKKFYCKGDAPIAGTDIFNDSTAVKIYYLPETQGWGDTFGDRPTVLWTWRDFTYDIVQHLGGKGELPYSTVTITGYTGAGGAVSIPSTIEGFPVTIIGELAFNRCSTLTSIIIPDRATSIEAGAFALCDGLKNVSIPHRVTSIGDGAFARCSNLKNICFKGNAPIFGADVFIGSTGFVLHALGASGWGPFVNERPVGQWNPMVETGDGRFGMHHYGYFGFTISGPVDLIVIVEESESLIDSTWTPISTNTLTDGSTHFTEAQSTNRPACYYRLRMP